ncbi:9019_t:CDS:1 [Ambispora gerdemannii]|uniref:9019_t:CDS:1 n=1 Tax=Ambispora gerdemannii TaxID=144530 RepID=A0A9N9GI70_9GLOM|nr:9019_t:CDS:1 [Ambispora gerdemannii]
MPPRKSFKKKTASQNITSIPLRYNKNSIVREKVTPPQPITKFFEVSTSPDNNNDNNYNSYNKSTPSPRNTLKSSSQQRINRKSQSNDAKNNYRLNQFGFSFRQEPGSPSPSPSSFDGSSTDKSQQREDSGIGIDFDIDDESKKDNDNRNNKQKQKSLASDTTEILPPADAIRKVIEENLLDLTDKKNSDSTNNTIPMRPSSLGYNLINIIPEGDYNSWFMDENGNKRYSLWKLAGCRDDITKTIDFYQY